MHEINKIVLMQQKVFCVCASSSILRCFEMTAAPWSKRDLLGPQWPVITSLFCLIQKIATYKDWFCLGLLVKFMANFKCFFLLFLHGPHEVHNCWQMTIIVVPKIYLDDCLVISKLVGIFIKWLDMIYCITKCTLQNLF